LYSLNIFTAGCKPGLGWVWNPPCACIPEDSSGTKWKESNSKLRQRNRHIGSQNWLTMAGVHGPGMMGTRGRT
jgi:hypothetical protein